MIMFRKKAIHFLFVALYIVTGNIPLFTKAGVNLKNGNFYISYTDHDLKNTGGISIERTYNSKTTSIGLFGFGWGSEFETRLFAMSDGSVFIREFGGGAITGFVQTANNNILLTSCINDLVKAAIHYGDITNNPAAINNFKKELRESEEKRRTKWEKYTKEKLVTAPGFADNTSWSSKTMGSQLLIKTATGFKRTYNDGSYYLFNNDGFFTGKYDKYNKAIYQLAYDVNHRIAVITDNANYNYTITTNEQGFITQIKSSNGLSVYLYDGNNLVNSTDAGGNKYRYAYDDKSNMISIGYSDGTFLQIEYYNVTLFVKKITDRNGVATQYVYKTFYDSEGKVDNDHYATWLIKENSYTGKPDSSYYEYEIKPGASGERYTYRMQQRINGIETETIYSETCNNPLLRRRGKRSTVFKYNNNCNLIFKETDDYISRAEYDRQSNKIIRTEHIDKTTFDTTINVFTYNSNGDLIKAMEGSKWITLAYNSDNRIIKMEYEDGVLTYEYNKIGKPSRISVSGKGSITVEYNTSGEISKVESPDGPKVSLAVTQAMQALLSRIKPKGLDFN